MWREFKRWAKKNRYLALRGEAAALVFVAIFAPPLLRYSFFTLFNVSLECPDNESVPLLRK